MKFYIPSFVDGRGRFYLGTNISPTFFPIFRSMTFFAKKSQRKYEKLENSTYYQRMMVFRGLIRGEENEKNIYLLIVLYIEVGKYFIKSNNEWHNTAEIIEMGIKNVENYTGNIEKDLELNKVFRIISSIKNKEEIGGEEIIYRDATASGIQNAGILYGYKKEKLRILNLEGRG